MAVSLDPWVNVVEVGWEARLGLSLTNVPGGLASWEWIGPTTAMTSEASVQVPDDLAPSFLIAEGGIQTHIWLNPVAAWAREQLGSDLPLILVYAWRFRGSGLEPGMFISGFMDFFRWGVVEDAAVKTPPLVLLSDLVEEETYDEVLWSGIHPLNPSVFVHVDERRLSLTL